MLKFWVLLCDVEHSETILRIGFAKLLLKKQKTAGEKQTGVTPGWPGTTQCLERGKRVYYKSQVLLFTSLTTSSLKSHDSSRFILCLLI